MHEDSPEAGWSLVAEHESAAALIGTLTDLDPDVTYSRSDIAERAGVALKTLYLDDTLEELVEAGLLDHAADGSDGEQRYELAPGRGLDAARAFDEAVAAELGED
jgi:predicted hydrolase (HD superfamily)